MAVCDKKVRPPNKSSCKAEETVCPPPPPLITVCQIFTAHDQRCRCFFHNEPSRVVTQILKRCPFRPPTITFNLLSLYFPRLFHHQPASQGKNAPLVSLTCPHQPVVYSPLHFEKSFCVWLLGEQSDGDKVWSISFHFFLGYIEQSSRRCICDIFGIFCIFHFIPLKYFRFRTCHGKFKLFSRDDFSVLTCNQVAKISFLFFSYQCNIFNMD